MNSRVGLIGAIATLQLATGRRDPLRLSALFSLLTPTCTPNARVRELVRERPSRIVRRVGERPLSRARTVFCQRVLSRSSSASSRARWPAARSPRAADTIAPIIRICIW